MLLRAMSAHRAFYRARGGAVTSAKIAYFLRLNPQCPRSLRTCVAGMNNHIGRVAKLYGRETPAQGATARLLAELESQSPKRIFDDGLPEFLSRFIRETAILATVIHVSYPSGDIQG